MTRRVTHIFSTVAEANAFQCGVEWVNDSAIEVTSLEVYDDRTEVWCDDEDGYGEEFTIDHREHV